MAIKNIRHDKAPYKFHPCQAASRQNHTTCGRSGAGNWQVVDIYLPASHRRSIPEFAALRTAHLQQLAMHMNDVAVACAFMQIVDVLRHQQKAIAKRFFKLRLTPDAPHWVVFPAVEAADGGIIKCLHQPRITGESFPAWPISSTRCSSQRPSAETYEYQTLQKFLHL